MKFRVGAHFCDAASPPAHVKNAEKRCFSASTRATQRFLGGFWASCTPPASAVRRPPALVAGETIFMDSQRDPWVRRHGSPAFSPLRLPTRISPWAADHTAERVSSCAFQSCFYFCLNRSWAEMVHQNTSGPKTDLSARAGQRHLLASGSSSARGAAASTRQELQSL